jgi:hypothetical protein
MKAESKYLGEDFGGERLSLHFGRLRFNSWLRWSRRFSPEVDRNERNMGASSLIHTHGSVETLSVKREAPSFLISGEWKNASVVVN